MPPSLPSTPTLQPLTIPITGLLVDIYGLPQLPSTATSITCLWLHHARTRSRGDMADIASRCITAYNSSHSEPSRGLIALAWDQRNHGSRLVSDKANGAWREGNERHAQDMFGVIAGCVADQGLLIDALGGYLFLDEEDRAKGRRIDGHLALGISLGGHSVWQTLMADERVRAGVVVIGCPDFECEFFSCDACAEDGASPRLVFGSGYSQPQRSSPAQTTPPAMYPSQPDEAPRSLEQDALGLRCMGVG